MCSNIKPTTGCDPQNPSPPLTEARRKFYKWYGNFHIQDLTDIDQNTRDPKISKSITHPFYDDIMMVDLTTFLFIYLFIRV